MTFISFREWWVKYGQRFRNGHLWEWMKYGQCLRNGHLWEKASRCPDDARWETVTCARCGRDQRRAVKRMSAEDVRRYMLRQMSALERARPLCPDHRDKAAGQPCLLCEIERLRRENDCLRKDVAALTDRLTLEVE